MVFSGIANPVHRPCHVCLDGSSAFCIHIGAPSPRCALRPSALVPIANRRLAYGEKSSILNGMFEHRKERLLSLPLFYRRVALCLAMAAGLVAFGLGIGVLGYRYFAGFEWIDALLNASMILTGMGPVGQLPNDGAKIFASLYALFSGLVFISVMALVASPVMHRMLHHFHIDDGDFDE